MWTCEAQPGLGGLQTYVLKSAVGFSECHVIPERGAICTKLRFGSDEVLYLDESTLVDRTKDCIIVSGFNVHPGEVEAVLLEDPTVAAAVVVGVPAPRTGERVEATVVPAPGATVSVEALLDRCRDALARYKVPAAIHVADAVPRGVTGKALRRKLRPLADS